MSPRGEKLNEQMRADAMAKITKAALEVFAEYGYHGATMEQIKQVSGLSKGGSSAISGIGRRGDPPSARNHHFWLQNLANRAAEWA
jgi:hypothetical protein